MTALAGNEAGPASAIEPHEHHGVGLKRHMDIPMINDFTVLQTFDFDQLVTDWIRTITGDDMRNHQIALRDHLLGNEMFPREGCLNFGGAFFREALFLIRAGAIDRVIHLVIAGDVSVECLAWLVLVEHQIDEVSDDASVRGLQPDQIGIVKLVRGRRLCQGVLCPKHRKNQQRPDQTPHN